ncbi:MAG TPA: hypothetical protein VGP64_10095 [Polyangia bacterium]
MGFRFLFAYYALFAATLFSTGPGEGWLTLAKPWHLLVRWTGKHLLHVAGEIRTEFTGSGDRLYDWLLCAICLAIAAAAMLVWSIVDRRRARYDRLAALLRVGLRYHLALSMFSYGFAKVFKLQFPAPGPGRLSELVGDLSPMGLLWTFMGASTAYSVVAGGVEVLGGLLLLFRRTTTLGALVVAGVMTNVALLNFSYDVGVKLFSLHLLVTALVLIVPEARRLADLLVLHRPTTPRPFAWVPKTARWRWARRISKAILVVFLVGGQVRQGLKAAALFGDRAPKPAGYGSYDVEAQTRDGKPVALLPTDPTWFRSGFIDRHWSGLRDGAGIGLIIDLPPREGLVDAILPGQQAHGQMRFTRPDPQRIVLEGAIGGENLLVRLKRRDTPSLLESRGFHWVNEAPFNR